MKHQTLPQLIQRAAQQFGQKLAIKEPHQQFTYQQLNQQRLEVAKAFIAAGITKGDRVAIWAPNIAEWIFACLGLQTIGAILVPLNTRMKGSEAADIINRSGTKILFTVAEFQSSATTSIHYVDLIKDEIMPTLERIVLFSGQAEQTQNWQDFINTGADIIDADVEALAAMVEVDDVMDMLFTSGTTGKPKGVLCGHQQNLGVVNGWADTVGLRDDDNYLIINPFFHSFGYKAGWLAALVKGATIFPVLSFDLDKVLRQIEDDQISMLPGPPTIYQSILAHPDREKYNLSSLRLAVTGAAAVPVELVKRMRSVLGFETVVTAYGLTESCGFVSICRPEDDAEIIATTSGRAMEGVEVKCVDGDGNEVTRGEPGEIWVRGYNVMQGYFDNEEETRKTITADGWLKTGDIGVMDEAGYLRITDRIKDMYISGGFNVYPAEIENALTQIEDVVQCAVVGIADERMGEVGHVFIVKKQASNLSEEDVIIWAKSHLANYKVPRKVTFLDTMPINAAGKILKTELRVK